MKMLTRFGFMVLLSVMMAAPSYALTYTYSLAQLDDFKEIFDSPKNSAKLIYSEIAENGLEFGVEFKAWDSNGFSLIGVGDTDPVLNMTGFDDVKLKFYNSTFATNADMWVNLFLVTKYQVQTGTKANGTPIYAKKTTFYETSWTQIAESAALTLSLDFLNAHAFSAQPGSATISDLGWGAVSGLDNVIKYGFMVGNSKDTSTKNYVHAAVAPVPEPGTLLLLGSGLVGLAYLKRRKKA